LYTILIIVLFHFLTVQFNILNLGNIKNLRMSIIFLNFIFSPFVTKFLKKLIVWTNSDFSQFWVSLILRPWVRIWVNNPADITILFCYYKKDNHYFTSRVEISVQEVHGNKLYSWIRTTIREVNIGGENLSSFSFSFIIC